MVDVVVGVDVVVVAARAPADLEPIGRTQLQDAVPMTFGQEFHAWATFLKLDLQAMG